MCAHGGEAYINFAREKMMIDAPPPPPPPPPPLLAKSGRVEKERQGGNFHSSDECSLVTHEEEKESLAAGGTVNWTLCLGYSGVGGFFGSAALFPDRKLDETTAFPRKERDFVS